MHRKGCGIIKTATVTSLKKNREFREVYRKGKSVANRQLVLYYYRRPQQKGKTDEKEATGGKHQPQPSVTRIGLTVSKKVGKSVVRNKVKRRLKDINRKWGHQLPQGYDLVWIARVSCSEAEYHTLLKAVYHLLHKVFPMIELSREPLKGLSYGSGTRDKKG